MAKEVEHLGRVLHHPERPFVAILGGAKVSDKLEVIENLIRRVDALLIGGAMAYTFLKGRGVGVGRSLVEEELLDSARQIERRAKERSLRFELPVDHVVAPKLEAGSPTEVLEVTDPAIGDRMGLDIGPKTVKIYRDVIGGAQTVVWNGPMGVFEIDAFANGTLEVARAVASVKGTTVIGGGQSRCDRSDYARLDRRRRVARIPRRPRPAGAEGAGIKLPVSSFQLPAPGCQPMGDPVSWELRAGTWELETGS